MKKFSTLKKITTTILLVALMTTTVFAATSTKADLMPAPEETSNMLVSGTVTSIEIGKEFNTIEITNDNMGMIFHVGKTIFVIDQKTNKILSVNDIKKGMKITVVLDKMAPMTMSIPAQTNGAVGIVILSESGSVGLSIFNGDLVNLENTLQLNIGPNTQILHQNGSKMIFGAEDLKGQECLVLYSIATLSIPAQTNPEFVMILNGSVVDSDGDTVIVKVDASYLPLRALAEAKGFDVKWVSHKKPIILSKDDMKIELLIGETSFTFTHMTRDIKPLDLMKALDLAVLLKDGVTMVPDTFIDAL